MQFILNIFEAINEKFTRMEKEDSVGRYCKNVIKKLDFIKSKSVVKYE